MSDLISKSAAQAIPPLPKCYREYETSNLDDAYDKGWEDALFSLNALPTIDPVKHGQWIKNEGRFGWHCSVCREDDLYAFSWNCDKGEEELQDRYCPNCGAQMERRKDERTD